MHDVLAFGWMRRTRDAVPSRVFLAPNRQSSTHRQIHRQSLHFTTTASCSASVLLSSFPIVLWAIADAMERAESHCAALRTEIKAWEREFQATNGKKPARSDV